MPQERQPRPGGVKPAGSRPVRDAGFAVAYAEQNRQDHARLVEALRDGTLEAVFQD